MACGSGLMKTLMFVFNGIVWVLGLVLFVVGVVVLVEGKNWNEIVDNKTVPVSVMLIIVGLVIAVVGFLGCCGAMKQNGAMLLIYAIVLGVIIILQCVAGILAFIYSDETKLEDQIAKNMDEFIKNYSGKSDVKTDHVFNVIMEEFECCGISGPNDWNTKTDIEKWVQDNVPDSCCVDMEDTCGWDYFKADNTNKADIHNEGCFTKVVDGVKSNMELFGIIALVFILIEILQLLFALILRNDSKDGYSGFVLWSNGYFLTTLFRVEPISKSLLNIEKNGDKIGTSDWHKCFCCMFDFENANEVVQQGLEKGLTDYGKPPSVDVEKDEESYWTTGIDWIQENLECCGITDGQDWSFDKNLATYWISAAGGNHKVDVPDSCCTTITTNCGAGKAVAGTVTGIHAKAIKAGHSGFINAIAKYDPSEPKTTDGIDWLQKHLDCCGIQNASDWRRNADKAKIWIKEYYNSVPDSCCKRLRDQWNPTPKCGEEQGMGNSPLIHNGGCYDKMTTWLYTYMPMMGVMALAFIFFESLLIAITCLVRRNMTEAVPVRIK
ncbi:hypothetical protein ACHWQZ_G005879 [Mnemiopsis leidyi]